MNAPGTNGRASESVNDAAPALQLSLPPELFEELAQRVAAILAERQPAQRPSAWLDTAGAAAHLCCSVDRVHDLVASRRLSPRRDGRRLLFRPTDLDAYLEAGA